MYFINCKYTFAFWHTSGFYKYVLIIFSKVIIWPELYVHMKQKQASTTALLPQLTIFSHKSIK